MLKVSCVTVSPESVTKEVSDADRRRLSVLEQSEAALKLEVSKLKVCNINHDFN